MDINISSSEYQEILENRLKYYSDLIIQKIDDVIMRDFKSAIEQFDNCVIANKIDELDNIKLLFLNNIGLSSDGVTGGVDNTKIIALSYLGLIKINLLQKKDYELTSIYILRMFATGERFVRTECFPIIYEDLFKEQCGDIERQYLYNISRIAKAKDYLEATGVGIAKTGAVLLGLVTGRPWHAYLNHLKIPDVEYFRDESYFICKKEEAIDKRCSELSQKLLNTKFTTKV